MRVRIRRFRKSLLRCLRGRIVKGDPEGLPRTASSLRFGLRETSPWSASHWLVIPDCVASVFDKRQYVATNTPWSRLVRLGFPT
jgi:hypothetical protein